MRAPAFVFFCFLVGYVSQCTGCFDMLSVLSPFRFYEALALLCLVVATVLHGRYGDVTALRMFSPVELSTLLASDVDMSEALWQPRVVAKHIVCQHGYTAQSVQVRAAPWCCRPVCFPSPPLAPQGVTVLSPPNLPPVAKKKAPSALPAPCPLLLAVVHPVHHA